MVTVTAILPGSTWPVLVLITVTQDAMGRICHFIPEFRIRFGHMKLHLKWVSRDLQERTRDLYTLLTTEMKNSRSEISVTKESKEGNSKMEVPNPCLIRRLDLICKEECLAWAAG